MNVQATASIVDHRALRGGPHTRSAGGDLSLAQYPTSLRALELIEERTVADIEPPGGLLPAPSLGAQNPKNDLPFEILCRGSRDLFQRNGVFEIDLRHDVFLSCGKKVCSEHLFVANQDM